MDTILNDARQHLFKEAAAVGLSVDQVQFMESFARPGLHPTRGFATDFCGSKVRVEFLGGAAHTFDNIVCTLPIPGSYTGEAGEWYGIFKAVAAASDSFHAMELGAGHGPWLGVGGYCAAARGIENIHLCGVEADPTRASWMHQHMIDNGLHNYSHDLRAAAVGVDAGIVRWPRLDHPAEHSGGRPVVNDADAAYLKPFFNLDDMIEIEMVSMAELLLQRPKWDLVHMDVQGNEIALCEANVHLLNARVRYLIVGTHWRSIDGQLMDLMFGEGWALEYEKPTVMRCPALPNAGSMFHYTVIDGVQVWHNPRLD